MPTKIEITFSDEAAQGWQAHLDETVNPQRDAANQLPHTIESFFQEVEEASGVRHYVQRQRLAAIIAKASKGEKLSQAEVQVVVSLQMK